MPYGTLAERIAASKATEAPPPDRGPVERLRHCWVVDEEYGRLPGLLLSWRHDESGWVGRVIVPVLVDETWEPVERWVPADELEQG